MSANSPINIDELMARIRNEVARRKPKDRPEAAAYYSPGDTVRFGAQGNSSAYAGTGWSHQETDFRWTDGETAELIFAFDKPPGDLILSFTVHPMLGGSIETQEVSASWNGVLVGEWNIREAKSYHTLILSQGTERTRSDTLKFNLPQSFSPASKNLGGDSRRLGLAFYELVLRPARDLGL